MSTTTFNPDLKEALAFEQAEVGNNLEELMAQFLDESNRSGDSSMDEMKIRRMAFAVKYLEDEAETLTRLKGAVTAEWDRRITAKTKNIADLKGIIRDYIKNENKGKALKLDVGTISLRKKAANITAVDAKKMRAYLAERGDLQNFLKPADLDATLAKNDLLKKIENNEVKIEDIAELGKYEPEDKTLSIKFK